jgi:EAL domain-containing protein (putative c-di-GMP-specific phosphodiesterase class I)/ActR/RegA family two-component response regulator
MAFARNPAAQFESGGTRRRLAILDDDQSVLRTVGIMARRLGLEVMTCQTLRELEAVLKTFKPDALLIDLMMPDSDGIDAVRQIGPLPAGSLYVMSGADKRTFDASREVLASCGVKIAGFLHKPFRAADLARALTGSVGPTLLPPIDVRPRESNHVLSPAEFQLAVLAGRIEPNYQPIFNCDGRTLKGFEALARVKGMAISSFAPAYLDQLATDPWLAEKLTDLVIEHAFKFLGDLPNGHDRLSISINVFGEYAVANGFREAIVEQCARYGIARSRVILELSEAAIFNLNDDELRKITQLRLAGFGLSIDDFGTGHSSLGRLASLPFSELKIDKTFCLALPQSQPAAAVIEACLGLAARLDMTVTAEGVENEEVAAVLASMGCDALQGHLFGRAMPAEEVTHWLRAIPSHAAA